MCKKRVCVKRNVCVVGKMHNCHADGDEVKRTNQKKIEPTP